MNMGIVLLPVLAIGLLPLSSAQNQADLFKSGRIRLAEEVRLSDKNLPENSLFQNPRSLDVDAQGNVYVSDFDANHIKVFGPDGKFRTAFGRKGQGPGDLSGPANIEITGLSLYRRKSKRIGKRALRFPDIHQTASQPISRPASV